jgi:hypothetical protein
MATTATHTALGDQLENIGCALVSWTLANGETGDAVALGNFRDRSVQVGGTFGVGGNCVIEGSNDGTNYVTLTDPQGNALNTITAARLEQITETTRFIRARISAGDGTTAITIHLFCGGGAG